MSLSVSEIIRKNPIGTAFDSIRNAFASTCEKHGLASSTRSLNKISDKGGKRFSLSDTF